MKNDPPNYDPDAMDEERKSRMTLPVRRLDELTSLDQLLSIVNTPSPSPENISGAGWKQDAADELARLLSNTKKA